jgi:hypothetical protein
MGAELPLRTDGRTERQTEKHDKLSSRFSQLGECI